MKITPDLYSRDGALRTAFSWLTRVGLGPKFGTMPIAYYQMEQVAALDALEELAMERGVVRDVRNEGFEVRVSKSNLQARSEANRRWTDIGSLHQVRQRISAVMRRKHG